MILPILAIWKKDFKSLMTSPMFYILLGFCCLLWGALFSFELYHFVKRSYELSTQGGSSGLNIYHNFIATYIVLVHYILIFMLAAFSIRYFAEEKKLKTFSIYLMSPLSSFQIVFAKWLVGLSLIFVLLLVSSLFPLSLLFFVSFPFKLFLFSYLGLFLILSVYMSASLLASSLTESMIVCMVVSLVFSVLFLLLGTGAGAYRFDFFTKYFSVFSF